MINIKRRSRKPSEENKVFPAVFLSFKTPVVVLLAITVIYLILQLGSLLSQGQEKVAVPVPRYNISPYSLIFNSDMELKAFDKTDLSDLAVIKEKDADGINYTGGGYYSLKSLEAGKPFLLSDIKRAPIELKDSSVVGIRVISATVMGGALMGGENVVLYSTAKDPGVLGINKSFLKAVVLDLLPLNDSNLSGRIDLVLAIPNNETATLAKMISDDFLIARDVHITPICPKAKGSIKP